MSRYTKGIAMFFIKNFLSRTLIGHAHRKEESNMETFGRKIFCDPFRPHSARVHAGVCPETAPVVTCGRGLLVFLPVITCQTVNWNQCHINDGKERILQAYRFTASQLRSQTFAKIMGGVPKTNDRLSLACELTRFLCQKSI